MEGKLGFQKYNETNLTPLILDCGHTFCKSGLEALPTKSCPSGKATIYQDVAFLKKNFAILDTLNEAKPVGFVMVEQGEEQLLIHCQDCDKLVIRSNRSLHQNHKCTILNSQKSEKLRPLAKLIDKVQLESSRDYVWLETLSNNFQGCRIEAVYLIEKEVNEIITKIRAEAELLKHRIQKQYSSEIQKVIESEEILTSLKDFSLSGEANNSKFMKLVLKDSSRDNFEILEFIERGDSILEKFKKLGEDKKVPKMISQSENYGNIIRNDIYTAIHDGYTAQGMLQRYRNEKNISKLNFSNVGVDFAKFTYDNKKCKYNCTN